MVYLVSDTDRQYAQDIKTIGVGESLSLLFHLQEVGLDTETTGLHVHKGDYLKLLQLGCKDFQIVIDCMTIDILNYKAYLESDRCFLGWNLKFDLQFLFSKGIVPKKLYDGYLAERLMWLGYPKNAHSMSLKTAAMEYSDASLDKSVRGKIIYSGLSEDIIRYAADDVKYLGEIKERQSEKLEEKGLSVAIKYENAFLLPLAYMQWCGIKLDKEAWKKKSEEDTQERDNLKRQLDDWVISNKMYKYVDTQGNLFSGTNEKVLLNWDSPQQVLELLKGLGLNLESRKGDSVDSKVLMKLGKKCDLIPIYLKYKEKSKLCGTYGQKFIDSCDDDGRIRTEFDQLGANTTRITSGGDNTVNLLNLPADKRTRSCFVSEKGNKWISIDYSGQEAALMASIANDKAMIHELMEGSGDLHSLTAYMCFNEIPRDTPIKDIKALYPELRSKAKSVNFGINYGGSAQGMAFINNFSLNEAQRLYDSYMNGFKGIKAYQDFHRKDWRQKGYILINPKTGHKVFIPEFEKLRNQTSGDIDRHSINYPIQGTGSLCFRVALINFFAWLTSNDLLYKVKLCIGVYDEINCEAPEEIAEDVASNLYECMIKAGKYFCVNCKLDAEISRVNGILPDHWVH